MKSELKPKPTPDLAARLEVICPSQTDLVIFDNLPSNPVMWEFSEVVTETGAYMVAFHPGLRHAGVVSLHEESDYQTQWVNASSAEEALLMFC